nr:nucleotidyltransferase family protein [Aquisalimonas asiatica]
METLNAAEWRALVPAARETSLLGTLWVLAGDAGLQERLPEQVARHLFGGYLVAERNGEAIRWELEQLQGGLLQRLAPPVALKGAAYLMAELPNARGRLCNDIDLLVPREQLERAETLLFYEGWVSTHHDDYDQRYYREWMHELPPMHHLRRGATLDLHHNILPETFAVRVPPERLLDAAQPLPPPWRYRVFSPPHLVLHAVVHLLQETEWDRALRDLYDIHILLRHHAALQGGAFWDALEYEARSLGVAWLLAHALDCCARRLGTHVPAETRRRLDAGFRPSRSLTRAVFRYGLNTRASVTPVRDAVARGALFLRGHWLKMPPRLLARHLFYKAFLAPREADAEQQDTEAHRHG